MSEERARPPSLEVQALDFANELADLLVAVLPGAPHALAEVAADRVVVRPEAPVPVHIRGVRLATLEIHIRCVLDHRGEWLAVESSSFKLSLDADRTPLFRFEFVRAMNVRPSAHLQIHAQRGALSHLLSRAGHPAPHEMAELHLPLGGARYRPCVEDVLQFLATECHVDVIPEWEHAVRDGRARWRSRQARAVARDFPVEAAETLQRLGYEVLPPAEIPATSDRALHAW